MSIQARPLIIQQGISVQRIGDEVLLYDEQRHQAFCLNATTAAVWDRCNGSNTLAEISRSASLALGTPVPEPVVEFALAELRGNALLAPELDAQPGPMPIPAAVSRRAMMQSLGASSLLLLPVVAMVLAPKAAQAYSGCFDCSNAIGLTAEQRQQAAAEAAAYMAAKQKEHAVDPFAQLNK